MLQTATGERQIRARKLRDDELYYYAKNDRDRAAIDEVVRKYPVKLTPFLRKMIRKSEAVRRQFLPQPQELETTGTPIPFEEGKKSAKTYGLERVYRDRVLLAPNFDCPAYCRYCYKKSRVLRRRRGMSYDEIDEAVAEISTMGQVRGVVVTGGEPLLDVRKLFYLLDRLVETENVREIRVGTRALLNSPHVITRELAERLASYNRINERNPSKSRYLALNVHFNHVDELVPEVVHACNLVASTGVMLRNQTVLLRGVNDGVETMKDLFATLLRNRILVYYMNHCMPVEGADHLRTTVQQGIDIYRALCTESSSAVPNYVYAPPGGKVHVGPDTVLKYKTINGRRFIETKMLYRADEFRSITGKDLPPMHRETSDGYIAAVYADGGDVPPQPAC